VALRPLSVFKIAPSVFQKWAKQKMTGYLGEGQVQEVVSHGALASVFGSQSEGYVKEMSSAIKDLAQNQKGDCSSI
jgi:hypothetical protein